jgi:4-diphosphocytidyl-2-C-methyl-D-erythritol kinase
VPEANDLTMRAARLLKQRTSCPLGADIELVKRLPLGGGVGGGSSDAATALMVLNRLWETGLSRGQLMQLGAELGADVPFFVFGESAFAEGIGDKLTPVSLAPAWYLVLIPPVAISSAEIFASAELKRDAKPIAAGDYVEGSGANALQAVACARYPEVGRYLEWLARYGEARMTGSGACVFASFAEESAARSVLAAIPAGMQGFVAQGLDRHPLPALVGDF